MIHPPQRWKRRKSLIMTTVLQEKVLSLDTPKINSPNVPVAPGFQQRQRRKQKMTRWRKRQMSPTDPRRLSLDTPKINSANVPVAPGFGRGGQR